MRLRLALARLPIVLLLVGAMTLLLARSSLVALLPSGVTPLWVALALLVALLPALFARETPVPAAALVLVPALAASAYGASRLDWLRVLKDFGVAEENALDFARLGLSALALVLLYALHALDLALRLRGRAIERGIDRTQASAAAKRSLLRNAQALGVALAGAAGILLLALGGLALGARLPVERAALAAPLIAAALLAGAALWLARARGAA